MNEKKLKEIEAKTIERLKKGKEDCYVKKYLKKLKLEKSLQKKPSE
jgi:hypothetical protein